MNNFKVNQLFLNSFSTKTRTLELIMNTVYLKKRDYQQINHIFGKPLHLMHVTQPVGVDINNEMLVVIYK